MRLIDADALMYAIANTVDEALETDMHTFTEALNRLRELLKEIVRTIDKAPTINPEDCRPQGRWQEVTVLTTDDIKAQPDFATMRCDKCDRYHTTVYLYGNPTEMMHYCPNCGAKMDATDNNVGGKMDGKEDE